MPRPWAYLETALISSGVSLATCIGAMPRRSSRWAPFKIATSSSEQVKNEPVTTSTDVYAMGVVLYRLLTGRSPYILKGHNPGELFLAITRQDPQRISDAVRRTGMDARFTTALRPSTEAGLDRIELTSPGPGSFDELRGALATAAGGTLLRFDDGGSVLLQGIAAEQLRADDFLWT